MSIKYKTVKTSWGGAYRTPADAQCGLYHGGNHNLVRDQGSFQCVGCGTWYSREQVTQPEGEMGQGGVVPLHQ